MIKDYTGEHAGELWPDLEEYVLRRASEVSVARILTSHQHHSGEGVLYVPDLSEGDVAFAATACRVGRIVTNNPDHVMFRPPESHQNFWSLSTFSADASLKRDTEKTFVLARYSDAGVWTAVRMREGADRSQAMQGRELWEEVELDAQNHEVIGRFIEDDTLARGLLAQCDSFEDAWRRFQNHVASTASDDPMHELMRHEAFRL